MKTLDRNSIYISQNSTLYETNYITLLKNPWFVILQDIGKDAREFVNVKIE